MGKLTLSICVPTLGNKVEKIRGQLLELEKVGSDSVELLYSISEEKNRIAHLQDLRPGSAAIHVHNSGESFAANLENVVRQAKGDYVLLLGDDDTIQAAEILALERLLLFGPKFNLGFALLHKDGHLLPKGSALIDTSSRGQFKKLSSAVAAMRAGSLPGILLRRESIKLDFLNQWLQLFPKSIYPQIVIAMTCLADDETERAKVFTVKVEVGEGEGLLDPTFQRLGDYGAEERLTMASYFLSLGVFTRLAKIRYDINLAIWESSIFQMFHNQHPEVTHALLRSQLALFPRYPVFSIALLIHRLWSRLSSYQKSETS